MCRSILLRLLTVAIAIGLICTGNAFAAGKAGTYTLSPMVGYHKIDGGLDLDDDIAYGLGFGYYFSPKWAIEADLRYTPTESDPGSSDVDILTLSAGAQYHLSPESAWNPYVSFGLGVIQYDIDANNDDDEDVFGYYGGGLKYALSEKADFRLDIRHLLNYRSDNRGSSQDDSKWRHHLQAMAGFSFNFGGPEEPAPAPAPAPVVKEEPMAPVDSDKDGVLDPQDQCPGTAPGVRVDSVGCPADTDGDGVPDFKDACVDTPRGTEVDEHGCPKAAKEVASLTLNILFGVDKDQVTPFHAAEMKKAAEFIKKYPMYNVVVEGHTDSQGSDEYNQSLSQRRADSVRDALVEKYGFPANQISASGYGESQPVAENTDSEGRAKNRRVEISIRP